MIFTLKKKGKEKRPDEYTWKFLIKFQLEILFEFVTECYKLLNSNFNSHLFLSSLLRFLPIYTTRIGFQSDMYIINMKWSTSTLNNSCSAWLGYSCLSFHLSPCPRFPIDLPQRICPCSGGLFILLLFEAYSICGRLDTS